MQTPNIMIVSLKADSPVMAKVGDFGLASRLFLASLRHKLRDFPVGNSTWLAPEILREEEYTVKSDVYSFGIILSELLTGYVLFILPFNSITNNKHKDNIHTLSMDFLWDCNRKKP
jgi:serine/threonine protein kinase